MSDGVSLELTTLRLGRPILHLARLFASSSIKFRPCLLEAWAPNKSRPCPLGRSNQVSRVLYGFPGFPIPDTMCLVFTVVSPGNKTPLASHLETLIPITILI